MDKPTRFVGDDDQKKIDDLVAAGIQVDKELIAQLRTENHVIARKLERIQQLVTAHHESKEAFVRRVQSVLEWKGESSHD